MFAVVWVGVVAAFAILFLAYLWFGSRRLAGPTFKVRQGEFNELAAPLLCTSGDTIEVALKSGERVVTAVPPDSIYVPPSPGVRERLSARAGYGRANAREAVIAASPQIAVGSLVAFDVIRSSLLLDDAVSRAITQLSGEPISGLADFRRVVDDHGYQLESAKIQGTVAEQVSADHFIAAGAQVEWPPGGSSPFGPSNNPGWDYMVDGCPVNVKAWSDAGGAARSHFAQDSNADTPIVVPADSAHIPSDAVYFDPSLTYDPAAILGTHLTVVDQALTLDGIDAMTTAAAEAAVPDFDASDGIPGLSMVIVAVRSGYQQGKLVHEGKSTASRATKNVAIDAGLRGGGALAGAKSGLLLGAGIDAATGGMTLGLGAAGGAIVGAIAGGMVGGEVARRVKLAPLHRAQADLSLAIAMLGQELEEAQESAQSQLSLIEQREAITFHINAEIAKADFTRRLDAAYHQQLSACVLTPTQVCDLLERARMDVDQQLSEYERSMGDRFPLSRLLAGPWIRAARRSAHRWHEAAWRIQSDLPHPDMPGVFDVLLAAPRGKQTATDYVSHVAAQRAQATSAKIQAHRTFVDTLKHQRGACLARITNEQRAIAAQQEADLAPRICDVEETSNRVRDELMAAGAS